MGVALLHNKNKKALFPLFQTKADAYTDVIHMDDIDENSLEEEFEIVVEELDKTDEYYLYKQCVLDFTYLIGTVHKFIKEKEAGKELNHEFVSETIDSLGKAKENLLKAKKFFGLSGGLDFLGNNKFDGFEIKDGVFVGDTKNVLAITTPWMKHFNPENCYLYEVAHYIQYLAFSEELYCGNEVEAVAEVVEKLSLWEKVKGGIKKWQRKSYISNLSA